MESKGAQADLEKAGVTNRWFVTVRNIQSGLNIIILCFADKLSEPRSIFGKAFP